MSHVRQSFDSLGVPGKLSAVGIGTEWRTAEGESLSCRSPIDGSTLAELASATTTDVEAAIREAEDSFTTWRMTPAPVRGQFVRRLGEKLRQHKQDLATLVTWEAGKITQEALGEVQEMIDICDFAVGISRQLYGLTIASERPMHRLMEQWHPLGPVGVITAFNFPVAVWAWNAMIAWVCGDSIIWKPSEKTPLAAIGCQALVAQVMDEMPEVPAGISNLVIGGREVGQSIAASPQIPLVSATGSVRMGKQVAGTIAARLGRALLELGGNNGLIVTPAANLELAIRGIVFAAVGTCGQRCTTLRRLIVHEQVAPPLVDRLKKIYRQLPVGHPAEQGVLVGPLIDEDAWHAMQTALTAATSQGGKVTGGERLSSAVPEGGVYVQPALVEIPANAPILREETFAPILYIVTYEQSLEEAIAIHNDVPQGLASAIFTNDVREAELFCSPRGSDCGIVNVNIGTSGAEIGGAFGGEKDTGGGRESGSDSWKAYMRRTTNTINYSSDLPLAQGIQFDI